MDLGPSLAVNDLHLWETNKNLPSVMVELRVIVEPFVHGAICL